MPATETPDRPTPRQGPPEFEADVELVSAEEAATEARKWVLLTDVEGVEWVLVPPAAMEQARADHPALEELLTILAPSQASARHLAELAARHALVFGPRRRARRASRVWVGRVLLCASFLLGAYALSAMRAHPDATFPPEVLACGIVLVLLQVGYSWHFTRVG